MALRETAVYVLGAGITASGLFGQINPPPQAADAPPIFNQPSMPMGGVGPGNNWVTITQIVVGMVVASLPVITMLIKDRQAKREDAKIGEKLTVAELTIDALRKEQDKDRDEYESKIDELRSESARKIDALQDRYETSSENWHRERNEIGQTMLDLRLKLAELGARHGDAVRAINANTKGVEVLANRSNDPDAVPHAEPLKPISSVPPKPGADPS